MSTLAPIADKLGKLLRLLASDRDGEVVAAAQRHQAHARQRRTSTSTRWPKASRPAPTRSSPKPTPRRSISAAFDDGRRAAEQDAAGDVSQRDDEPSWHEIACAAPRQRPRPAATTTSANSSLDMVRWTVRGGEPTREAGEMAALDLRRGCGDDARNHKPTTAIWRTCRRRWRR